MSNTHALQGAIEPALSVVIPCYNEVLVIEETVETMSAALIAAGINHEILCVNNNSSDNTEAVLARLAQRLPHVRTVSTPPIAGYGVAVRWGLENYAGQSVVIVMADGSELPSDVITMFRKVEEGFDCAFGDRFAPQSKVEDYPVFKLIVNRAGNALIGWLMDSPYRDFTNGFKCYSRRTIDAIQPLVSEHFNLTVEMSIGAVASGARFAIVPNSWKNRDKGVSKFKLFSQSRLYLMTIAYCLLRTRLQGKRWRDFRAKVRELEGRKA